MNSHLSFGNGMRARPGFASEFRYIIHGALPFAPLRIGLPPVFGPLCSLQANGPRCSSCAANIIPGSAKLATCSNRRAFDEPRIVSIFGPQKVKHNLRSE